LSSTDKAQNSSSGLKITVNIPSDSLDAWLYPDFPQLHTRAQPTPSTYEFSPAVAKAISTGQNMPGLESARCALKQTNHPQRKQSGALPKDLGVRGTTARVISIAHPPRIFHYTSE